MIRKAKQMSEMLNIEDIMAKIQREAKEKVDKGLLPDLECQKEEIKQQADWTVSCANAVSGNRLKQLYAKFVSKLIRCALFPITERITHVHFEIQERVDRLETIVARQNDEIRALRLQNSILEDRLKEKQWTE